MQACLLEGKQDSLNLRRVDLAPLHDFGQNGREQVFRYAIFETTFLCLYKPSTSHIFQGIMLTDLCDRRPHSADNDDIIRRVNQ